MAGLDVNTNLMAIQAANNLSTNQTAMQNALTDLSSGYQINSAADNPAGLVISQHLQSQINGFQQAQANTQNAVNVAQTMDGALNEIGSILQTVRTLAVQSANSSASDTTATTAAQAEITQALSTIDNIAQTTVFGSNNLLWTNGGAASGVMTFNFQVGYGNTGGQVSFTIGSISSAALGIAAISVTTLGGATGAISAVDTAIQTVSSERGTIGAYQNMFQDIAANETVMQQNLTASNASIQDTNMATMMVKFTQDQILVQAGVSMLSQANSIPQDVLKLLG
jgi:flagellin